jgi:hypothetical protein
MSKKTGMEEENEPALSSFERAVRHMLKADLIRAQEAYDSLPQKAKAPGCSMRQKT